MKVLILGGAGFIGSNLVKIFVDNNCNVTVIDGLLDKTGARIENLSNYLDKIIFIQKRVEDTQNLPDIISKQDVVIDSMAWTSHLSAIKDPLYDLELNVKSHLYVLKAIINNKLFPCKIIYLGSRGQYGNPIVEKITEITPMVPEDIQGIHKLTAENYYRIYSKLYGLNIISLRIPNCFGENQPYEGEDIGLIGSFVKDSLKDKTIEIYGKGRKRNLIYVKDLCNITFSLSDTSISGFSAYNVAGHETGIEDLVKTIIKITDKGKFVLKSIPEEIKNIDTGFAQFDDTKLRNILNGYNLTILQDALKSTIDYLKGLIK
jgi:UDP-glucose 4-epimerase